LSADTSEIMRMRITLVIGFAVISALGNAQVPALPAGQGNLLRNGGFNAAGWPPSSSSFDVLLQGWTCQGSLAWTYRPTECLDGGGELGFGGPGSVSQTVNTKPGETYRLTLMARSFADLGSPPGHLLPTWGGFALPVADAPVSYTGWTEISYDVQATGAATLFQLSYVDNGPVWVDSVSLVAVPEPSSLAFWLATAGACCAISRRTSPN
jgi:hypothetical protein